MDVFDPDTGSLLPAWYAQASCANADPAAFFPDKGEDVKPAQAICTGCPVREPCLQLALHEGHTDGVWGGATANQRRRMARQAA